MLADGLQATHTHTNTHPQLLKGNNKVPTCKKKELGKLPFYLIYLAERKHLVLSELQEQ